MAAKRGKSQARRNTGSQGGLPGWAWLVLGIVLTIAVVMIAPRFLRSSGSDGFFRPSPNPDAQPAATRSGDEAVAPDDDGAGTAPPTPTAKPADPHKPTQYDFYTMLPGNEVVMSDAELAASARAESEHRAKASAVAAAGPAATSTATTTPSAGMPPTAATAPVTAAPAASGEHPATRDAPYLLQAGAFGASGDAEAIKARVALLGLSARVESAAINGKTVYRVRMGPYGTALELAEAKRKLANGGLPALAIKAK